jgi:fermentation-respiration switch protein FrsA (DUF1100 family)
MGRADFDISKVSPLNSSRQEDTVPVLMCHAVDDELLPIAQSEAILAAYTNPNKRLVRVKGGHNGRRPVAWIHEGCLFAMQLLDVDTAGFQAIRIRELLDADPHFESYEDMVIAMESKRSLPHGASCPMIQSVAAQTPAII